MGCQFFPNSTDPISQQHHIIWNIVTIFQFHGSKSRYPPSDLTFSADNTIIDNGTVTTTTKWATTIHVHIHTHTIPGPCWSPWPTFRRRQTPTSTQAPQLRVYHPLSWQGVQQLPVSFCNTHEARRYCDWYLDRAYDDRNRLSFERMASFGSTAALLCVGFGFGSSLLAVGG